MSVWFRFGTLVIRRQECERTRRVRDSDDWKSNSCPAAVCREVSWQFQREVFDHQMTCHACCECDGQTLHEDRKGWSCSDLIFENGHSFHVMFLRRIKKTYERTMTAGFMAYQTMCDRWVRHCWFVRRSGESWREKSISWSELWWNDIRYTRQYFVASLW